MTYSKLDVSGFLTLMLLSIEKIGREVISGAFLISIFSYFLLSFYLSVF
jgi:hypothetical protein